MIPQPITINGRTGTVLYVDANWHPVPSEQATMAQVLFDDGGSAFYMAEPTVVEKFDEAKHPRDKEGQFTESKQLQGDEEDARIFFHGTAEARLADILRQGLLVGHAGEVWPDFSHRDSVYMTDDEDDAQRWARLTAERAMFGRTTAQQPEDVVPDVAILTIRIPDEYVSVLKPDENFDPDTHARQFKGNIPPSWIIGAKVGIIKEDDDEFVWHEVPLKKAAADGKIIYVVVVLQSSAEKQPGVGGITKKFDESKHPRGEDGRFKEATQPRIFNRPEEVEQYSSWGETRWQWKSKPGLLLTGEPIPREQLPETLYHVTTNAPAVESSGVLLGQQGDTGLGGGQAEGVSLTTSREDAMVIQRELKRAVRVARGEDRIGDLDRYAREDEQMAGLPPHTLDDAVQFAKDQWVPNQQSIEHTFVWDKDLPEDKRGYVGPPPPPEEQERLRRSSMNDALKAYLQIRGRHDEQYPLLKNPILFGRQEHLAKLNPENIQILEVPSAQIPAEALVTTGSDTFLHEVRAYSDVPIRQRKKVAFDEAKHPRTDEAGHEGEFTESGHSGEAAPDPELAKQAKAGIAAVEKLIPEAMKTADFTNVSGGWEDLPEESRQKAAKYYADSRYDDIDIQAIDADLTVDVRWDLREGATPETAKKVTEKTKVWVEGVMWDKPLDEFASDKSVSAGKPLDFKTLSVPDPNQLTDAGYPVLDLNALRHTDGTELTGYEKDHVRGIWKHQYEKVIEDEVQIVQDSDEYLAKREVLVKAQVQESWDRMTDEQKNNFIPEMIAHGEFAGVDNPYGPGGSGREPKHWVTGVEVGSLEENDYALTHAIATKLTELRTDELRKERGLLAVREKPDYTIEPNHTMLAAYGKFVVKDAAGTVVTGANNEEIARRAAEEWALREQNKGMMSSSQLIQNVWTQWKMSSSEGVSLSMQLAAARELGGHHRMTQDEVEYAENEAVNYGGMATLQAYVRAQWEVTQTIMHKAGEEKIDVYRALMLNGDQIKATPKVYMDKLGQPLAPPSNIQTGIDKNTQSPFVSYEFNGEHFVVIKEREPYKSILDAGPQTWHDVSYEQKAKMLGLWQAKAAEAGIPEDKAAKLYAHLGDDGRYNLMQDYISQGLMQGHVPPHREWESDESAIQRRMARYESDQQYTGNPKLVTKLPALQLKRAGAQSTTGTLHVANDWGGVGNLPDNPERVVIRIQAPSTSVFSIPVYGENEQSEHETVLLGTKDHWLWDAWHRVAPDFTSQSIAQKADMKPLVVDLQAVDRGNPHWMSTVNWANVLKWEEVKHPRDEEGQFTRVAMTSQRTAGDPGYQSNAEVFQHMQAFHKQLEALPGVSAVSVKPGVGGWEGGSESMWQIYYKGNGEARKLVAKTAKAFNQDAVLILNKCEGENCQPAVELSFAGAVSPKAREHVHRILVANGIGGWTWMKRNGKTLLRMVSVPQWGGDAEKHQQATAVISQQLREDGLKNSRSVRKVAVSVMEREGAQSYDSVIGT